MGRVLKSHHQRATRQPMPQPDRHQSKKPPEQRHRNPRYTGARNRRTSNETTFLQAESILDLFEISSVLREPRATETHTSHAIPDPKTKPPLLTTRAGDVRLCKSSPPVDKTDRDDAEEANHLPET
ncbi:hypothetical protein F2Q69_00041214 [Brassica cretica]|uniref:Uncharacterized protein n=1 Tax=Brassica cretica TaxID=69181 RepID=A0A8S9NKJ0_BRACR|nr:hypothetical protein F2Q69_00041214 [Brassica cretica]